MNMQQIKEEIVIFLRNADILSTTQRGVTNTSEMFSGTGASQMLTLSNNVVRNIRSITVDGTEIKPYLDYTPSYGVATTTVTGTFASGTNNITVDYDYSTGTAEKIWPDYPQLTYIANDTPRIGFDFTAHRTQPIGIGSNPNWLSDALVTIKVYDKNLKNVDSYISTIRSAIKSGQISFYWFPFVTLSSVGPPFLHSELASKVFERSVDVILKFGYES